MYIFQRLKSVIFLIVLATLIVANVFPQTDQNEIEQTNFPYSKNPTTKKTKTEQPKVKTEKKQEQEITKNAENTQQTENQKSVTDSIKDDTLKFESTSIANKTLEIVRGENEKTISPTEIYKVGIGDILFISLENAPPNVSTYFTVLKNGAIDYPLAGGLNFVIGMTPEEIENHLRSKIKLFENPQLSVKVREHSSHKITVLGLVEKPGMKYLQREAVPLFVIRAEAIVQPKANQVAIRRAESNETEKYSLLDSNNDNILIFPGDIVEFSSLVNETEETPIQKFYYIGGNIKQGGQKKFFEGITLTQAVLASGGLKRSRITRVYLRRKNEYGLLITRVYDLKKIKNGLEPDPLLQAGDTIEIKK